MHHMCFGGATINQSLRLLTYTISTPEAFTARLQGYLH